VTVFDRCQLAFTVSVANSNKKIKKITISAFTTV